MKSTYLLAAALLTATLAAAGCGGGAESPTGVSAGEHRSDAFGTIHLGTNRTDARALLACEPLAYAFAEQTVGAAGGTVNVGPHKLTIPAGALTTAVRITAEAPVGTVNSVRFGPEGLTFVRGKPATLTLSYANCPLVGRLLPKRIAYTTNSLAILTFVVSGDDLFGKRVRGQLEHFSRYAVAW